MKQLTIKERLARLEAVVEERTKTLFSEIQDIKKSLDNLNETLNNHITALDNRISVVEAGQLSKREKLKVYGSIATALIMAVASIVVQLLK